MPVKIPAASKAALDREQDLINELSKYDNAAWHALRHQRLEDAGDGAASPEAIASLAELPALGREWNAKREALYHALQGLRDAAFITIRDEVLKPAYVARQARREGVDADIQSVRKKYPGLQISYDPSWDSAQIAHLKDLCSRNFPISNHIALSDIVGNYVL
jgi:hypothetical protein